jgi:transcriptional regulator with XRE-family HTH domain
MAWHTGDFGTVLRGYRTVANLTQEDLAHRTGLSVHAISMLERGVRRTPRSSTVEFLAAGLDLDSAARGVLIAAARPSAGELAELTGPGGPPDPAGYFAGREPALADLRRLLVRHGRVTVYGLGGTGKSQLAAHYLHRWQDDYPDGTFWLRMRAAGGPPDLRPVARRLRGGRRWLLVLDDLAPPHGDAVPDSLPGHVLVTASGPTAYPALELGALPRDAAGRLLLDRTGQADTGAADAVAETLGGLPLALAQAAGYLTRSGRDLASYARLLPARLVELMAQDAPDNHPVPVTATIRVAYERVARDHPVAARLLFACVSRTAAEVRFGALPVPLRETLADDLALDHAVAALRRYSLLERCGDALRVHRLTGAVVRACGAPAWTEEPCGRYP